VTREVERLSAAPFDLLNVLGAAREDARLVAGVMFLLGGEVCCFCGDPNAKPTHIARFSPRDIDSEVLPMCGRCAMENT